MKNGEIINNILESLRVSPDASQGDIHIEWNDETLTLTVDQSITVPMLTSKNSETW